MTQEKVGRYVIQVELAGKNGNIDKYDVVLCKDDHEVHNFSGCLGEKSSQGWKAYATKIARRLTVLYDALEMAQHNLMCYSKTYLMTEPKEFYEEKWQKEHDEIETITEWINQIEGDLKGKYYRK